MTETKPAVLVIGVGNPLRRDDGVGPAVAQRLSDAALPTLQIAQHHGEGLGLIDLWQGYRHVVIVDATRSGAAPGAVRRFELPHSEPPSGLFHYSSHLFGLAEAIALARTLKRLPEQLVIYGIEGVEFGYGEGLSSPVLAAVDIVVDRIMGESVGKREAGTFQAAPAKSRLIF